MIYKYPTYYLLQIGGFFTLYYSFVSDKPCNYKQEYNVYLILTSSWQCDWCFSLLILTWWFLLCRPPPPRPRVLLPPFNINLKSKLFLKANWVALNVDLWMLQLYREKGMWIWQTILSENFSSTPFPFFSPCY